MKHVELARKSKSSSHWTRLAAVSLLAVAALVGCGGGSDGAPGAPGAPGASVDPTVLNDLTAKITALTQAASPETCSNCHTGDIGILGIPTSGKGHQFEYDKYKTTNLAITLDDPVTIVGATSTLTFTVTRNGAYLKAADIASSSMLQKRFYASHFNGGKVDKTFAYANFADVAGTNKIQATNTAATFDPVATDAQVYAVLADTKLNTEGTLYDNVINAGKAYGAANTFASTANESACTTCHGGPTFLKAGYRAAKVAGLQDFGACRSCHVDDPLVAAGAAKGGHFEWQLLKDNPARLAEIYALIDAAKAKTPVDTAHDSIAENMTAEELAKYAYVKSVMNDVHMSHNMEFPYPQSMQNCATCHAGKLDTVGGSIGVLDNSRFTPATCISCHAVEGLKTKMKAAKFTHDVLTATDAALKAGTCTVCHDGATAPTIKTIHNGGFNPKIYTVAGQRYSDVIKVTMDTPTITGNKLTIKFSAADTGATGFDMAKIKPTVLVGLYGYDSKDFIVAAHASNATDKKTNLEYVVGTTHPRFTTVSAAGGKWEVTADLTLWADKIAASTIKRAEIAVMPYLDHPTLKTTTRAGAVVPDAIGLDAPSVTFNLSTTKVEANFGEIVNVKTGCNSCHDQLATTFHTADRGGNIKVCRICHEVSSPGYHLEMQSRSIDSYVHAIHSFQAFDLFNIDLTDPVQAMKYKEHTNSTYPNFTIKNCESCHKPGTYDVPNQGKSMPGLLSGSATLKGGTRNIGTVPAYVTGPAARACGSCHRSDLINADDATGLAVLNSHFLKEGYLVENVTGLWDSLVAKLMAMF